MLMRFHKIVGGSKPGDLDSITSQFNPPGHIFFYSRSVETQLKMYGLTLKGMRAANIHSVLDCGAGPSMLTAFLINNGFFARAVDLEYGKSLEALKQRFLGDIQASLTKHLQLRKSGQLARLFGPQYVSRVEQEFNERKQIALRFLEDYEFCQSFNKIRYQHADFLHGRLSFQDHTIDLVLVGNLLFNYAQLGDQAHIHALKELCRVARREVRIYPVINKNGVVPDRFKAILRTVEEVGWTYTIEQTPYQRGRRPEVVAVLRPKEWAKL